MNKDFWKNKKVLITGHTGFKGSWLALWLEQLGARVTGYSLAPPTEPSLFTTAQVDRNITSIIGDIRNFATLKESVDKAQPDIIFHMAAQSLVRLSYDNPVQTYETNVMGTIHLLESVRTCSSVKAVVNVTSDKCYDNKEWVWGYRENEAMGGYDPYSNSKGCAELVTAAYRSSYFKASKNSDHQGAYIASARAGNVIGGGDWAKDRLIPDLMRAFMKNASPLIRNPDAIRPWQHVLEPLSGYLLLAENLIKEGETFAEGWNFGPRDYDAKPVRWIADKLVTLWGDKAQWILEQSPQPHEAHYLRLDCSKAQMKLKWQPVWSLEKSLIYITEWFKAYQKGDSIRKITLTQIANYETDRKESSQC
jgi:CDP-glucose 4,6-dehydratase